MSIERYSVNVDTPASVAAGAAYAELLASAGSPVSVKSITLTTASNIGGQVALARSYVIGTGTTVYTAVAHRTIATQPTGPARVQTAWSSAPTGSVSFLKQEIMPVATGQQRTLWDSSRDGPLVIEPGASVMLMNHASGIQGGLLNVNFTWEEGLL